MSSMLGRSLLMVDRKSANLATTPGTSSGLPRIPGLREMPTARSASTAGSEPYGITNEEFEAAVAAQGGRAAVELPRQARRVADGAALRRSVSGSGITRGPCRPVAR
jgi:hypothetical protein